MNNVYTQQNIQKMILEAIQEVAPEIEQDDIDMDEDIREECDLDSMDFLNYLIALKKYDPASYWSKVSIPPLIIDASQEELFDIKKNGEKLHHFLKNKVETKYIPIEGTHYDLYKGEGYKKALFEAEQWFFLHLK